MPANLPQQYLKAEERYRHARTPEEKMACLEEMWALLPKHKGTDKLQAKLKKMMSRLRIGAGEKKGGARKDLFWVPKEGAGQVALVGPPNAGKSKLISTLTKAESEVATYPFTTRKPIPGMLHYKDIQIQLLDIPAVSIHFQEYWIPQLIRNADALLVMIDMASEDPLGQMEELLEELKGMRVKLVKERDIESDQPAEVCKATLIAGNKIDVAGADENYKTIEELYGTEYNMMPVSCETSFNLDALSNSLFRILDIIRVYTKPAGKKMDLGPPYTIRSGATILDMAEQIHKDFVAKMKYARVWGSAQFDGQQVQRDYVLSDGDIIEIHL